MKLLNILALGAFALIAACATATTTVLEPSENDYRAASIKIEHGDDTVAVDDEYGSFFREKLAEALFEDGAFSEGDALTLRYRFIQLDQGSRAQRYLLGPIAGKGTMTIEIRYFDPEGAELARINTGGEVSGGFVGGSFKSALEKAANEAADYAVNNFRQ